MPKKLKNSLVRVCTWSLGFGWALVCITSLKGLFPSAWVSLLTVAAWIVFLAGLFWQSWAIYCGVYRDGTFLFDETDE